MTLKNQKVSIIVFILRYLLFSDNKLHFRDVSALLGLVLAGHTFDQGKKNSLHMDNKYCWLSPYNGLILMPWS